MSGVARGPTVVAIDGEIVPAERATIGVFDRGFLYGDSVFEVLRTYRGAPFTLEEHVARLERSAARVHIPMPVEPRALGEEIVRAVEAARAAAPTLDWWVRIVVTRGAGALGLDADLADGPRRVILVAPVTPPPRAAYENGIGVALVPTLRSVDLTAAAGAKVSSYMVAILATREAKARGAAEALIIDGRGDVLEGATSNVFVVKDGALATPPEESGILAGITRACVLEAARARGIAVRIGTLRPEDLASADEVFITSGIREVVPVVRVDEHVVGEGVPGPLTRLLHRDLRIRANVGDLPMPWE